MILSNKRITKVLIRLRGCAGWSAAVLCANPRASRPMFDVFEFCLGFEV